MHFCVARELICILVINQFSRLFRELGGIKATRRVLHSLRESEFAIWHSGLNHRPT
ncbi:hypothetical protein ALO83_200040 [Pseudomonas cannabina pv. alisalensis]|nr:hypothetical protein ALO83_200040 [Pseudomonas cannabina pv. alisalensis]RMN83189.1 hypothetical protein ALQ52_200130 [Pseudomonas cannabina pv. alisalensis]